MIAELQPSRCPLPCERARKYALGAMPITNLSAMLAINGWKIRVVVTVAGGAGLVAVHLEVDGRIV